MQAIKIASTLNMSLEEWREHRRKGIGGSDAGAILGLSPWASPLSVYCEKKRLTPEKDDSEAMRQGRDLEQYVAERFAEATGKTVRRCNYLIQHPDHTWMLANVDRLIAGEEAGLECKTTSALTRTEYDKGDIPAHYYAQCMHYLAVTGLERWYLAVLVLGKGFYVFEVERDEGEIKLMIAEEERFWKEHVEKDVPPAPNGTDGDADILDELHPHAVDGEVVLYGMDATIDALERAKTERDALDKLVKEYEQRLKSELGDAAKGIAERYIVQWPEYTRTSIDTKALKSDHPEIFTHYAKTSTYRRFSIKENKS